jgi:hypothetical protein
MKCSEAHAVFREANSEETSSKRLSELAKSDDILIVCAVASNKSTSKETIAELQSNEVSEVLNCLRKRGIV